MDENELFKEQVAFTYRMHRGLKGVIGRCLAELMARETQEALGEWSDNFFKEQENKKQHS